MDRKRFGTGHGPRLKCGGTNRDGRPCGNAAGKGTDHVGAGNCANHGGCTRSGRMAAVREQARAELAALDVDPVGDPLTQLALLAGQVLAWRDSMADRVNDLGSLRYGTEGGEQLRAEVALWERALDRAERVLVAMARLNIDERLARITEAQVDLVEKAVTAALASEGLDPEAQDRARRVVGRHLRAVP
jgi:hypothetical protein